MLKPTARVSFLTRAGVYNEADGREAVWDGLRLRPRGWGPVRPKTRWTRRILRKEVIQPQVPLRLPCYDLVPITEDTFGTCVLAVRAATSGASRFRGLTGGVYKAQEHIHRGMLIRDY